MGLLFFIQYATGALISVEGIMNSFKYQAILGQSFKASSKKIKMKRNFTRSKTNLWSDLKRAALKRCSVNLAEFEGFYKED